MADLQSLLGDKYTEGMTIEDVLGLDIEVPKADTTEYNKLKKRFDEVASELASSKKQLRANMTEAEQKALADAELLEAIKKERDELLADKKVAENEKGLLAIGYDEKLAAEVAKALYSGDTATVLAAQAKFIEAQKKEALANAVKDTPAPPVDNGTGKTLTKEQFSKMSLDEQMKVYTDSPDLYNELTKK
jgi:hypothetical protein